MLKNKYLKYSPEITLEIFTLIWDKLIKLGYKFEYDKKEIYRRLQLDPERYLRISSDDGNTIYPFTNKRNCIETTVQEILGYDPWAATAAKEFVLPERWYIKATEESRPFLDKWTGFTWKYVNIYFDKKGNRKTHSENIVDGYTEITFEQFKKYVLKESIETPKKGIPEYVECIKGSRAFDFGKIYKTEPYSYGGYRVLCSNGGGGQEIKHYEDSFKPSTKEAYDVQNQPKKPLKQAVHCITQEEWDFVLSKFNPRRIENNSWSKNNCCISSDDEVDFLGCIGSLGAFNLYDYQILSFQEWCDLNGYKMENKYEFKVGDWCIWKAGDKIDVFKVYHIHNSGNIIHGDNGNHYDTDKIRHATPEEINNHLISIGQIPSESICTNTNSFKHGGCGEKYGCIQNCDECDYYQMPAGDPIGVGLEPNENGFFKYTTGNSYNKEFSTGFIPVKPKTILTIDDEELPMVNIVKTKTINLLNNN